MEWKSVDGEYESVAVADFSTFYEGMFPKDRLLDIIKNFILFSNESPSPVKILAGYHQYFAVHKAIDKAIVATKTDGKGGVFWHTQGSGKSLSMVFYAHLLQDALDQPTIVVMTDRIDLDDQLYTQFAKTAQFLRQTPVQAESKANLKALLDGRAANGIIFTTMFKFEPGEKPLSERRNIIVMADEAHRGQYGFDERVIMTKNDKGEPEARIVPKPPSWHTSSGRACRQAHTPRQPRSQARPSTRRPAAPKRRPSPWTERATDRAGPTPKATRHNISTIL